MASTIRFEPNRDGFTALLTSPAVQAELERRAAAIATAAGEGFGCETVRLNFGGAPRVGVVVSAQTHEAALAQATGRVLSVAIDAGRG